MVRRVFDPTKGIDEALNRKNVNRLSALLAAVTAMLPGRDSLFALRRDRNPVFHRCVPMQIAIINYLAYF